MLVWAMRTAEQDTVVAPRGGEGVVKERGR
jgi:hypothetical protein